jgi:hypothetical protein
MSGPGARAATSPRASPSKMYLMLEPSRLGIDPAARRTRRRSRGALQPRSTGLGLVFAPPDGAHMRAVDRRRDQAITSAMQLGEQHLVQALPHLGLLPLTQLPPARHARPAAHLLGQILARLVVRSLQPTLPA